MFNNGHTFMLIVVEKFSNFAWAEPLKNKTGKSILKAFAKILNRGGRAEDVVFVHGPWSRVCQQTSFFNAAWIRNRFTFQRHKINKQNLPSPSEWSERFCRGSGDTSHWKTPKDTSTCFQIFTILQCNIIAERTKSSPTAIAQPTRDCAANRSSPSNCVVKLTF